MTFLKFRSEDDGAITLVYVHTGGRIDHAHHYNNAYRALVETLALEAALLAALPLVDLADTLLVVTADHSHVLTLGGLATPRGNPILGLIVILCGVCYC
jgi:alkaline phosphatase